MRSPKVGLLPLYIELYDQAWPEIRPGVEKFHQQIAIALTERGLEVTTVPLCQLEQDFEAAVHKFEREHVDAIVTLHLAYSPSLESAAPLAATPLPIVVLDTTPAYSFGPDRVTDDTNYNHGIHGVQDMCNLLLRNRKPFQLEVGHWEQSDVLDRVAGWARSARLAGNMRRSRVGRLGPSFRGMGDFAVPSEVLEKTLGIKTIVGGPELVRSLLAKVDDQAVEAEMASDGQHFDLKDLKPEVHRRSTMAGMVIRHWLEMEKLTAFTINFMAVDQAMGLPTMPFLEASKAMARGIGYAGEGDVLTAALVGDLASVYPQTSFTEMFCPDWKGNQIFLSHMGEMNYELAAKPPVLIEMPFSFSGVKNPAALAGRFRAGEAVLVNLSPGPDHGYTLIVAPVAMQDVSGADNMVDCIRGWFKPSLSIADFLAEFSRAGGTHHSALVYGNVTDEIVRWGKLMQWKTVILNA
jgi:L-arabinose isomerase